MNPNESDNQLLSRKTGRESLSPEDDTPLKQISRAKSNKEFSRAPKKFDSNTKPEIKSNDKAYKKRKNKTRDPTNIINQTINNNNFNFNFNLNPEVVSSIPIANHPKADIKKFSLMDQLLNNENRKLNFKSDIFKKEEQQPINNFNITINYLMQNENLTQENAKELINENKNYNKIEELNFLKNLAIITEGRDYCSAASLNTNDPRIIYVTAYSLEII